ncbi:DUF2931 family protein [Chryseobacterium ginsenosidimutans]|uniref:DUF2931 family protein n=1 Tax=Chryseobacterium ginsenosidimutans TaxID=687846 RepID=UPI0027BAB6C9|nr:DUF2931 family protein [Chryseobacterium ginsenosidimutans]
MKKSETPLPSYSVEISHPWNNYLITPVEDKILTLEGTPAHLPYGSSSGTWGNSGKGFTEQHGTPIGADIVYYSNYEDVFYHLKAEFPKDKMKDLVQRVYANDESKSSDESLKEFINRKDEPDYNEKYNKFGVSYNKFSNLVFGFAPKGMVVVWLRYGYTQIELGEFKAEVVKDDKKYADQLFSKISQTRAEIKHNMFIANASPLEWDKYRTRYKWVPGFQLENKDFKLFNVLTEYYNGEKEVMLRPWIENPAMKERALPKEIAFFWGNGKDETFEGRAFFNWVETDDQFENAGENFKLEFRIAPDNNSFQVLLMGSPIKIDSTRVYKSNQSFKKSNK